MPLEEKICAKCKRPILSRSKAGPLTYVNETPYHEEHRPFDGVLVEMESERYNWSAFGRTENEAIEALEKKWKRWAKLIREREHTEIRSWEEAKEFYALRIRKFSFGEAWQD